MLIIKILPDQSCLPNVGRMRPMDALWAVLMRAARPSNAIRRCNCFSFCKRSLCSPVVSSFVEPRGARATRCSFSLLMSRICPGHWRCRFQPGFRISWTTEDYLGALCFVKPTRLVMCGTATPWKSCARPTRPAIRIARTLSSDLMLSMSLVVFAGANTVTRPTPPSCVLITSGSESHTFFPVARKAVSSIVRRVRWKGSTRKSGVWFRGSVRKFSKPSVRVSSPNLRDWTLGRYQSTQSERAPVLLCLRWTSPVGKTASLFFQSGLTYKYRLLTDRAIKTLF